MSLYDANHHKKVMETSTTSLLSADTTRRRHLKMYAIVIFTFKKCLLSEIEDCLEILL
jgi:hypothetical protein